MKEILTSPEFQALIVGVGVMVLDGVLGKIPNKYVSYVGIIQRILKAVAKKRGK
jgi:hypothetical protein